MIIIKIILSTIKIIKNITMHPHHNHQDNKITNHHLFSSSLFQTNCRQVRHPGEGEAPGLARSSKFQLYPPTIISYQYVSNTCHGLVAGGAWSSPKAASGQKSDLKIESRLIWRTGWIWSLRMKKSKSTLRRKVASTFTSYNWSLQNLWHMTAPVYLDLTGMVRGILKAVSTSIPSKPPVPSRSRVNAVLGVRSDKYSTSATTSWIVMYLLND